MPGDVLRLRSSLHPVRDTATDAAASPALPLASQLPVGRLVELASDRSCCQMTQAVACLRQAQHRGETCAWVQPEGGSLFPPDLADSGVDLRSLIVVHVPRSARLAGLAKAAELMLRSGGFGMVVIDLWDGPLDAPSALQTAWQGRLLGMAREHASHLILLSSGPHRNALPGGQIHRRNRSTTLTSLGPLVSLRLLTTRTRIDVGRFSLTTQALKDKSGSLGALAEEHRRGPWGYR